jgi:hypothetical protein
MFFTVPFWNAFFQKGAFTFLNGFFDVSSDHYFPLGFKDLSKNSREKYINKLEVCLHINFV